MKKEFLKMAGVKDEKDFYKLFPTEEAFFGIYPEAKKLVQKAYRGGFKLPKAQDGVGNSMKCTSTGCKISEEGAWDDKYARSLFRPSVQKETPEFQSLVEGWIPKDERSQYSKDPNRAFGIAASRRYANMLKNPQYISSEGKYVGPQGVDQNFYNLMSGLYKGKVTSPEMLSEWAASQGEEGVPINELINKNYYTQLQVPTQTPIYFRYGGLFKAQDGYGNVLPEHQQIYSDELSKKIKWYEGRLNNPNQQIQNDARQVLEKLKQYPQQLDIVEYTPYINLQRKGALGQYDDEANKIYLAHPEALFNTPKEEKLHSKSSESIRMLTKNSQLARTPYVTSHEIQHYIDKPAEEIIKRRNKEIYENYIKPGEYKKLYNEEFNPKSGSQYISPYRWFTGTSAVPGEMFSKNVSKMRNDEVKRALDDARSLFNIDPSKDTSTEDWKQIQQKIEEKYKDKSLDPSEKLRYDHLKELFRVHGNDPSKVNYLNNLIVKTPLSKMTSMSRYGGGLQKKNFEKSHKFNNLLVSGVRKPNLFKAQDGLEYVQQLESNELTKKANRKKLTKAEREAMLNNPKLLAASILDPTGVSNYPYAIESLRNLASSKGFLNTAGNTLGALFEIAASLPMVGKAVAPIKGVKMLSRVPKVEKAAVKGHNILAKIQPIAKIDKKIYPKMYNIPSASSVLNFATPIGRNTRFLKGTDAGIIGLENYINQRIKQ